MTRDMTTGSPIRHILEFAFPVFLGILFQQLYSMVDAMIVGRVLGIKQLAGVGATSALSFLVVGCCNGICNGFAIPLAQSFGADDKLALRRYMANSVLLSAVLSVVIAALTAIYCGPILRLLGTPEDVYEYAYAYILIIFLGIPCTFLYNMTANALRAIGNSRTPVLFLIAASLLNAVLDLLFILVLRWGVTGAALATIISQGLSGLACLLYIRAKYPMLAVRGEEWKPSAPHLRRLLAMGIPMGLQYSITAIGSLSIQSAVNGFGSAAVAGTTAARKIMMVFNAPFEALGATMATYAGQNLGAGKIERIPKGLYAAAGVGFVTAEAIYFLCVLPFGQQLSALFIAGSETAAIGYYWTTIRLFSVAYPLLVIVNTVRFSIQGMGYSSLAMVAGFLEMAARCIAAFGLVRFWGFTATAISGGFAWLLADLFLVPAFYCCLNQRKKQRAAAEFSAQPESDPVQNQT